MSFFVHVAQHRHDQSLLRVHRQADVEILLEYDLVRRFIQARVEHGMLAQRPGHDLQGKGGERQTRALVLICLGVFLAQIIERRDVRLVKLRHARRRLPTLAHVRGDGFAQEPSWAAFSPRPTWQSRCAAQPA